VNADLHKKDKETKRTKNKKKDQKYLQQGDCGFKRIEVGLLGKVSL